MNEREMPTGEQLRVLYVDCSIGFGGATKSLGLVLRVLRGVDALVLTSQLDDVSAEWYSGCRIVRYRRVFNYWNRERLVEWARRRLAWPWLRRWLMRAYSILDATSAVAWCARIAWLLVRHRRQLVHLNNAVGPLEAIVAARLLRVPVVAHVRGFWEAHSLIARSNCRYVSRFIAVSDAVGAHLPRDLVPPEHLVTVYDPLDLQAFSAAEGQRGETRREWQIPPDAVAFGIFGRVVQWKGQLEFVLAAAAAMKRSQVVWAVVVGDESDGPAEYFRRVREAARQSGYGDRFVFPGYQPAVEAWYWAVDVVVHASIEAEPFGMVVPEGMIAGRPVIAADAGGPREMVVEGVDGMLVRPGDVPALAQAMLELAQDHRKRERMGAEGAAKVRRMLEVRAVAARVNGVYDSVLKPARADSSAVVRRGA